VTAESNTYPGVSCLRCGSLIPVSAKVVEIQDEIVRGKTGVPYAFLARCRMCEYESIYEIRGVQRFDGEPRARLRAA
jgi:hypothetical protein